MKKRLLNEETTRRFMKLANLGGLSETFVTETEVELEEATDENLEETTDETLEETADTELEEAMHEDEMEEDMYEGEHEDAEEPALGLDDELPAEEPEMDMGDEAPAGDLDASAVINAVAQATLDALKGQGLVSDETTVAVDDEGAPDDDLGADLDAPEPEPEMDMGMDMDEPAPEDEEADLMETTEDALEEQGDLTEDDAFISEIVRKVAERILAAKKNNS